ncbi:Heavy metal-associated domain HMA [Arabidopsis suecica]|uniref:Heavy metal-associated domain HMA n=1 Tax=Arabidopsis suecica TaxID=45249 RepID=A0A8T2A3P4_ARASU|nr:Heavy metal-associated domain HMA [Arabidopsis suecica]
MESHPPSNHPPFHRQQTRVLKLEPKCCNECARKVKRAMLNVEGVHSIKVNANEGTIEVNSEVDPQVLIAMAAKAGKRAELLWEPEPESPDDISTVTPPLAMPSTCRRQVHISNFDGFESTVHLQDLVDKNARGIKHMDIIDKRVIKITFKESHDDPSSDHSRDSPSPIAPPSSDPKNSNGGGGEASGSGACGNVGASATAAEPTPKINDAPCNGKAAEPPLANVNCSSRGNSCRLM